MDEAEEVGGEPVAKRRKCLSLAKLPGVKVGIKKLITVEAGDLVFNIVLRGKVPSLDGQLWFDSLSRKSA